MPITVSSLFYDSTNFMRNQLSKFILLALLAAIIQFSLTQLFPADFRAIDETYKTNFTELTQNAKDGDSEEILQNLLDNMNSLAPETQAALTEDIVIVALKEYSLILTAKLLLIIWTVGLILSVVNDENPSVAQAIVQSVSKLPKVLILGYLCFMLTAIGFALLILPGIVLYFGLAMAPVIASATSSSIQQSISSSFKIMSRYPGAVIAAVLFSIAIFMLGSSILSTLLSPFNSAALVLFGACVVKSLVIIFFTIYFYRLYSFAQSN